jgi:hypothetical protein
MIANRLLGSEKEPCAVAALPNVRFATEALAQFAFCTQRATQDSGKAIVEAGLSNEAFASLVALDPRARQVGPLRYDGERQR